MTGPLILDVATRVAGITLLLAIIGLAFGSLIAQRDRARQNRASQLQLWLLIAVSISLCGPIILGMHTHSQINTTALTIANLIASPNIALVWIFGLSLFVDSFRLMLWHITVLLAFTILGLLFRAVTLERISDKFAWSGPLATAATVLLFAHLLTVVVRGAADDLVIARRDARFRVALILAVGGIVSVLSEIVLDEVPKNTLQAVIVLGFAILIFLWLVRLDPQRLAFKPLALPSTPPLEDPVYKRLLVILDDEELYLEPGLTVADVARRLAIPPYQLRDLINRQAGQGNFSKFINSRRIEAAKRRLADPNQQHLPILTIALECGFNSIAPFNRAFRDFVGETPSAFRSRSGSL